MSPEILTARLQTACNWEWMPGILCHNGWDGEYRILEIKGTYSQKRTHSVVSIPYMTYSRPEDGDVPALSTVPLSDLKLSENAVKDPATRGCILAMVRQAHYAHICPSYENGTWFLKTGDRLFSASSEIEVLLLALETPV